MNKEALKQILDAMKLHTAETHPLVETESAMEAIEAELAKPVQPVQPVQPALPETLRLAEDLELNHEYCPKEVIQKAAVELRRLYYSEREGRRYIKEVEQDNANLREQNTWLDTELAELECNPVRREQQLFMEEQAFYESPTQRQPLTDEEIDVLAMDSDGTPNSHLEFARAIEAAHGIKEQS